MFGLTIGETKDNVIKQFGEKYEVIPEPSELLTSRAPESAIQYNNGAIKLLFNKGEFVIGIYIENFNSVNLKKYIIHILGLSSKILRLMKINIILTILGFYIPKMLIKY